MKKPHLYIICLVVLVAIGLRFWKLGQIPAGFHSDEASFGYNAYSLMRTGRDEYGDFMPLIMRGFNDYRAAIYSYITIPFIYVAGLNEWAVRAPTAVFGVLFLFITYGFVFRISKNHALSLVSMALAALSPVGILLSRVQSDPLVSFVMFYGAVYFWLVWVDKKKFWYLFLSTAGILISFYTYVGSRIIVLPFLLLIGAWYWRVYDKLTKIAFTAQFLIILLFVAGLYVSQSGTRFSQISVFSSRNVQLPLDEEIREDGAQHQPMLVTRTVHNKAVAYGRFLIKNYTDYLSFQFLFMQAGQPIREQIPNSGVLLFVEFPFLLIGIYTVIRRKLSYGIFSIVWLLLVPAVLSVLVDETPNIHRFFLAMIPIHLLVATGIMSMIQTVRTQYRKTLILGIIILFTLNGYYFLHELFVHQPIHTPLYRNEEDKQLAMYLKPITSSYDVIVSPKILEFMLFYWPVEPSIYQKEGSPRDTDNAWYRNFLFVNDTCPSLLLNPVVAKVKAPRVLYIDRPVCQLAKDDVKIHSIKYNNTLDAYYLIEKRNP